MTLPLEDELSLTPVKVGHQEIPLWHIKDLDAFLGRLVKEYPQLPDDDIPYYAWIWPSSVVLAQAVLEGPKLTGVETLELGCGLALVGLCAALQGAQVTLSDLQQGALDLAQRNAEQLQVTHAVRVRALDWRLPSGPQVDLILASDVLYEARFAQPLATALATLLRPGGVALLADPSRPHFETFAQCAAQAQLSIQEGPQVTAESTTVKLYAVRHLGGVRQCAPWEKAVA